MLKEFVSKIILNLKNKEISEERLKKEEERLTKEYNSTFELVDIYNGKRGYFVYDEESSSFMDFTEEDHEERIKEYQKYYTKLEKEGIRVFEEDEKIEKEKYEYGRNELHKAVIEQELGTIKRLIEIGIDTTERDNSGNTPFMLAVLNDYKEVIETFKKLGIEK